MNITHICEFCPLNELENVEHVITRCPLYAYERKSMLLNLQLGLSLTPPGQQVYSTIQGMDSHSLTMTLLGEHDPAWPVDICALLHRVSRGYFLVCWEKRVKMMGKVPTVTKDGYLSVHENKNAQTNQQSATAALHTNGHLPPPPSAHNYNPTPYQQQPMISNALHIPPPLTPPPTQQSPMPQITNSAIMSHVNSITPTPILMQTQRQAIG